MQSKPVSALGRFVDTIEETSIAACLGLMTVVTFANVVARYVFEANILWALELTVFLFAWLVLMGMSYGVKKHVHIGVDVVINAVSAGARKVLALIDLVAIAPFYIAAAGLIPASDLRFLRALRLLRVLKLTRYSAAFETLGAVFRENLRAFAAAFFVLIVVMLVAATGMFLFEREAQPEAFSSIPASMWWAFATLTTVGYGDITPITAAGKVFGAMISVVGIAMVALPTGILASAFSEQLRRRNEAYRIESDHALRDGIIDEHEAAALEALRERLGLSAEAASNITDSERTRVSLRTPAAGCCPHCGAAPTR